MRPWWWWWWIWRRNCEEVWLCVSPPSELLRLFFTEWACVCVCECELEFMSPFSCSSVNRGALGTTQRRRQTKRQVFACCFGERLLLWLPWRWLTLRMYKSGSVKFRGICESVCSLGTFSFSSIVEIQGNASVFNVFFFLLTFATKTTMSVCLPMGNLLHSTQHHPLRKRNSQGLGKWH